MSIKFDQRIVALAEASYASEPAIDGSDLIRTRNLQVVPYDGERVTPEYNGDGGRLRPSINTNPHTTFNFDVDYAGSGTKGVAPNFGDIIEACGYAETVATGTSVTYVLDDTATDSVTIWGVRDEGDHAQLQKSNGVRGEFGLTLNQGQLPAFNFRNCRGSYLTAATGASLTESASNQSYGVAMTGDNTVTAAIDSANVCLESFVINGLGNQSVRRNVPNCQSTELAPQPMTGTFTIKDPGIDTKDWQSEFESHSGQNAMTFQIVHGTASGNIVTVSGASAMQVTDFSEVEIAGGIKGYQANFVLLVNPTIKFT